MCKSCNNCVFVTPGTKCPECKMISGPLYGLDHQASRTAWGSPSKGRWSDQLGTYTYGKDDFHRKARQKGLEPA